MVVLGLDPGSSIMGFGVIKSENKSEKPSVIDFGCIITESEMPAGEKLNAIHKQITSLIKIHQTDIIAIETLFFFKNMKTVMPVSQATGVALLAAAQKNVPVFEFTPLQIKMTITGYGKATKHQIQNMVKELVNISHFDFKKIDRRKDDAFDALGAALCGMFKAYNHHT